MPLISEKDQQTLQKLFEELEGDVTITNFTQHESLLIVPGQECDYCKETRELLEEVTALSDKLHLETKDFVGDKQEADSLGVTRIPGFVLQGSGKGKIRFFGIPAGYEFSTLVEDILDLSKGTTTLPLFSDSRSKGSKSQPYRGVASNRGPMNSGSCS